MQLERISKVKNTPLCSQVNVINGSFHGSDGLRQPSTTVVSVIGEMNQ